MKLIVIFALVGSISCALRDHAKQIYIGAAINTAHLDEDATYTALAGEQFNCLTAEWEMKFRPTEPNRNQFDYTLGDQLIAFAKKNDMKVRGHALVWHIEVPEWIETLPSTELEGAMKNHITNVVTHFKGSAFVWDVVNEALDDNGGMRDTIWYKAMGDSYIEIAFQTARAADPDVKLYINDYSTEWMNAKSDALYNLVKSLKAKGVPIDGVGFQGHLTADSIPNELQENLQRFADLGVDVAITELDIGSGNPGDAIQAEAYAKVIEACVNVERCVGVTMWGITDNYSWRGDNPLPWDQSENPKTAVIEAIEKALK